MSDSAPDYNTIALWYQLHGQYYNAPTFPDNVVVPNQYCRTGRRNVDVHRVPIRTMGHGDQRGANLTELQACKGYYQLINGEDSPLPDPGTKFQYAFENEQLGYPRKKWDQHYAKNPTTGAPHALNKIAYDAARSLLSIFRERAASGGVVLEFDKLYLIELQIIGSTVRPVVIYLRD